jgi:hypothetical protein
MNMKTMLCAATLAATLGMAADALAAVGDPTGTAYDLSGRNFGPIGVPFGLDLLFESEYAAPDNDFTGFQQLGPGGGTAVSVDFDGVEQTVNGIAFNESYEVWDPSAHPAPTGHNDAFGILSSAPVVIPSWSTPSHLIEFSIRDPLGNLESGGGINRDIFESGIIRYDDVNPDGTTPSGVDATVLFLFLL